MYGFYINSNTSLLANSDNSEEFAQTISYKSFFFGYKSFNKFAEDKFFMETNEFILGLDGVILNLQALKRQYAISDFSKLIVSLFNKENSQFVSKLKGEFSGFIFEKISENLLVYNNQTATKQIFYSQIDNNFLIAPTLKSITSERLKAGFTNSLNLNATYNFLTYGGMIEEQTLVEEVYKLGAGEFLSFKNKHLSKAKYYDYNEIEITIHNKEKAVKRIDEVFLHAIELEYQKDKEYNYDLLATLSGGLDSRMNVMLAHKMGFKPTTFCFSQSNYLDEKIARKIANDLNLDFKFIPLDGGDYLKNLTNMVSINNGLQFYHGSAHYNFALHQLDLTNYGLMHTGQIGDGIFGGFVSNTKEKNYLSKTVSTRFINKTAIKKSVLDTYRDEEVFKLYQRVFNLANFGSYMVEQHQTYLVSPFMDVDVIQVALAIDPKLKINQDIYLDWMNQLHPKVTNYIWERTGFKPNKKWKTSFSRYTKKIKKEFFNATHQEDKLSMNPLDYWLKNNKSIHEFYSRTFNTNKVLVEDNTELFKDINNLFTTGNLTEKALVLTLLEIVRQLNLQV